MTTDGPTGRRQPREASRARTQPRAWNRVPSQRTRARSLPERRAAPASSPAGSTRTASRPSRKSWDDGLAEGEAGRADMSPLVVAAGARGGSALRARREHPAQVWLTDWQKANRAAPGAKNGEPGA